ncbi:MAG: hypothetical protein ACHQ1H_05055, partial [Nitrososphaerales archaeon]
RVFPQEESLQEELNVRLSRAVSAIGDLEKLRLDGKLSEDDFTRQLESRKDELEDVLAEMDARLHPTRIFKARTSDLYSSISGSIRSARKSPNTNDIFKPDSGPDDQKANQNRKRDENDGNENS